VRFAERSDLRISRWFEERETAAKRGRAVFTEMIRLLKRGRADGLILHKIDRGARNMKDWAEIGELSEAGIGVFTANETLDLQTRGGRLTADLQAVIAADYIRNLRDEVKKGFYGRLKQGVYPLPAPLGYLDRGAGKPKAIDPVAGPLVRQAFELYATGRYSLETLGAELQQLGFRNRRGKTVTLGGLAKILHCPFYVGIIRITRTGETFQGAHEPLVPKALFERVGRILAGKTNRRPLRHDFLFRRLIRCRLCAFSLIGERQKGRVYYRCHTKRCLTRGIREDHVEDVVRDKLAEVRLAPAEVAYARAKIESIKAEWSQTREAQLRDTDLQLAKVGERLERLTDAFLDGALEREIFEDRKRKLLEERIALFDRKRALADDNEGPAQRLAKILELAESAYQTYESAFPAERRELIETVTSNREVAGKTLDVALDIPFSLIADRWKSSNGGPHRGIPRTWDRLLGLLAGWSTEHPLH